MHINNFFSYNQFLNDNGIIYSYSGAFSQTILEEIGSVIKARLELNETAPTVTQKIFSIFVEQAQNIMKYSQPINETQSKTGFFFGSVAIVQENSDEFFVISGNYINNDEVNDLVNYIDKFRLLNGNELKALYKEKLKTKVAEEDVKSPGLGLIDMARKTSKPIEYIVNPVNDNTSFFTIKAVI